jgi:hypothetical protein
MAPTHVMADEKIPPADGHFLDALLLLWMTVLGAQSRRRPECR